MVISRHGQSRGQAVDLIASFWGLSASVTSYGSDDTLRFPDVTLNVHPARISIDGQLRKLSPATASSQYFIIVAIYKASFFFFNDHYYQLYKFTFPAV